MKKLLLTGIAALLLATGAAHAAEGQCADGQTTGCKFYLHLHSCDVRLMPDAEALQLDDLLALQKYVPMLRACDAFYKCVYKRDFLKHYAYPGDADRLNLGRSGQKSALGQLVF
jgi:hypothetical protein